MLRSCEDMYLARKDTAVYTSASSPASVQIDVREDTGPAALETGALLNTLSWAGHPSSRKSGAGIAEQISLASHGGGDVARGQGRREMKRNFDSRYQ